MHSKLFSPLLSDSVSGSIQESMGVNHHYVPKLTSENVQLINLPKQKVSCDSLYLILECNTFKPPFVHSSLTSNELRYLRISYSTFIPRLNVLDVPMFFEKCSVISTW